MKHSVNHNNASQILFIHEYRIGPELIQGLTSSWINSDRATSLIFTFKTYGEDVHQLTMNMQLNQPRSLFYKNNFTMKLRRNLSFN